jgi:hypothetical protein
MTAQDTSRKGCRCLVLAAAAALFAISAPAFSQTPPPMDPGWPREVAKDGAKLVYYQPQIDEWKDYKKLAMRMAFALTPAGGKEVLGVAELRAGTVADMEARTVVIKSIEVAATRFPSLDDKTAKSMDALLRKLAPTTGMTVSVDRITSGLERSQVAAQPVAVKTDPPTIFTAEGPAILLLVDGEPVLVGIENTGLKFIVNTNWDVLFDETGSRYYLLDGKSWLAAAALEGPWQATTSLPAGVSKLPKGQNFDDILLALPAKPAAGPAPQVFFSSVPAELIAFDDKPVFADIPGTRLVYATNTDSDVFVHLDQSAYYVLLSGRWFRAKTLAGPWAFAGEDLPEDFWKIPHDSPVAYVLASVPGTQEAADAVLLSQIPTVAVVNRSEAGDPKFAPIEGTSLSYATNTQEKVIKVGDLYYLCFQAVWFVSTSPQGPWKTADSVPPEIYSIPPSSTVYNVTYVTVYEPTPTTVTCSYTSGYSGVFVMGFMMGVAICYGSGYHYPPYYYYPPHGMYPIYHPYPCTYGVHAAYNPYTGGYAVGHYAYGPYGGGGQAAWYNPATGRYGHAATVQTPYGGRTAASAYNPYTGVHASTRQGSSPYAQWGSTAVQRGSDWAVSNRVTTSQGSVRHTTTSSGGEATTVRGPGGETTRVASDADNNVYAGHDGNVYKKDESGNWSKYENGEWSSMQPPSGAQSGSGGQPKAATQPATGTQPKAGTQPATGTQPKAATQPATGTQPKAATQPAGGTPSASGIQKPATGAAGQAPSAVPNDVQADAASRQKGSQRAAGAAQTGSQSGSQRSRSGGRRR